MNRKLENRLTVDPICCCCDCKIAVSIACACAAATEGPSKEGWCGKCGPETCWTCCCNCWKEGGCDCIIWEGWFPEVVDDTGLKKPKVVADEFGGKGSGLPPPSGGGITSPGGGIGVCFWQIPPVSSLLKI